MRARVAQLGYTSIRVFQVLKAVHRYVGYVIVAAIASRLVWGFVGPRHARFSDVVAGPVALPAI